MALPLSYSYSHEWCTDAKTINDFFGTLGANYGRFNLMYEPMQIYNCDETRASVVAEMGCHKFYAVTSAEKGKTHSYYSYVWLF